MWPASDVCGAAAMQRTLTLLSETMEHGTDVRRYVSLLASVDRAPYRCEFSMVAGIGCKMGIFRIVRTMRVTPSTADSCHHATTYAKLLPQADSTYDPCNRLPIPSPSRNPSQQTRTSRDWAQIAQSPRQSKAQQDFGPCVCCQYRTKTGSFCARHERHFLAPRR
jgi:hypothetical protein